MESGIVRASKRDSLRLDLDVELYEVFGMVQDGARVLGNPGSVLVVDDAQLERVELVQADDAMMSRLAAAGVSICWLRVVCGVWSGFWMAVASGTRINRPPAR